MSEVSTERTFFNGVIADIAEINPRTDIALAEEERVSFLPMQNTSESGDIIALQERVFAQVSKGYTRFAENDVLVAKITPCFENGKGGYAKGLLNGIGFGSTEFHIVRAIPGKADSRFLHHLTRSERFRKVGEGSMTGSAGQKRIPSNFIKDFPLFIPPLPEQKKIAEILSGIDDEINKFKNKIEALAFLKKSTANILIHQERFPLVSLQEVLGNGGSIQDGDWIESKDQDQDGKIRLVQLADIQEGRFIQKSSRFMNQDKADALNVTFLKKGDLLIARMPDPIGRSCIFPGSEQDCVTIVDIAILRSSMCNMEWLMHAINTSVIRNQIEELATGTTRKRISRGRLSEIYIPHPEKADQDQIAMHISSTETAIATLQVRLEKTMLLKSAIAADLLSGRTRVSV